MIFENWTPHDIVVEVHNLSRVTFPRSGNIARRTSEPGRDSVLPGNDTIVGGVPVRSPNKWIGDNLPEPREGVVLIVSIVFDGAGRTDLYRPDTGPDCIRNAQGQVEAVRRLLACG